MDDGEQQPVIDVIPMRSLEKFKVPAAKIKSGGLVGSNNIGAPPLPNELPK